jgi:hypothetical protein
MQNVTGGDRPERQRSSGRSLGFDIRRLQLYFPLIAGDLIRDQCVVLSY